MLVVFALLAVVLNVFLLSVGLFYGMQWVRERRRLWAYGLPLGFFVLVLASFVAYWVNVCSWVEGSECATFRMIGVVVLAASTCDFAIVEAFVAARDYWENSADS